MISGAETPTVSKGRLVRFKCNFREIRQLNHRLTEEMVAEAAGIDRSLYHSMELGFCDAFVQRKKQAEAEAAAGKEPRIKRIAQALGVTVEELVCTKLEEPYLYERPKKEPKPAPKRRFEIKKVEPPKLREIAAFRDYPAATIMVVLAQDVPIPGLTVEELMFVIAAVREREVAELENSPRFVLTRTDVVETVAAARTTILERRRK